MLQNRISIPKQIKVAVYERDNNTCQYCGKQGLLINRYGKPTIVEIKEGKSFSLSYKQDGTSFYNGHNVIPFEIDHIKPLIDGGGNYIDNLILSCRYCNRKKGGRSNG